MGMEWGCHRLQACALPPPPRGGRWKPRRSVPGVARGAGQRGRAAGRRHAAGGEEPATLLLSAEATGNRGRPNLFLPFSISANGCPIATWIGAGGAREARTGGCLPGASCNPRVTGCCCRRRQAHGLPERGGGGAAGVFPLRFSTAYRHPIVAIMAAGAVGSAATELSGGGGCTRGDRSAPPCWRRNPLTAATVQYGTLD